MYYQSSFVKLNHNLSIDFLRIIAMFMIVVLHVLGQGGILENVSYLSMNWSIAWLLEFLSCVAVNCYAMISGFVGIKGSFRFHRIVVLWLTVEFYTLLFLGIFKYYFPEMVNSTSIKISVLPFVMEHYWYITAYFGMFFFIPLINIVVKRISLSQCKMIILVTFIGYIVWPFLNSSDPFFLHHGYSTFWILHLYFIGACLFRFRINERVTGKRALIGYGLGVVLSWFIFVSISYLRFDNIHKLTLYNNAFLDYNFPLTLLSSLLLTIYFLCLKVESCMLQNFVRVLSPATLGVYLIHANYFVWNKLMYRFAVPFTKLGVVEMVFKILLSAACIYIICSLIDLARIFVFKMLKVELISMRIADNLYNVAKKLLNV